MWRPKKQEHFKQSLYFPRDMLEEIQKEAVRQDRSLSWMVHRAWRIAYEELKKYPDRPKHED